MALKMNYELPNGFQGEYWVASVEFNNAKKQLKVYVDLFKDKDSREAGKESAHRVEFHYNENTLLSLDVIYNQLKLNDFFLAAEDA